MTVVLTINSGSSSLKACLYHDDEILERFHFSGAEYQLRAALTRLASELKGRMPDVIGHRIVHGGDVSESARLLTPAEIIRLEALSEFAPLHMPGNLQGVRFFARMFSVPQVACFDTAFHQTMPAMAKQLPIFRALKLRRYGFHGLNYRYISNLLPTLLGDVAKQQVLIAHLGSGVSLCMLHQLKSVDTSMGFSPAGGVPMATRSGDLDPGVVLALIKQYGVEAVMDLIYHKSGLLALSDNESADMQSLIQSNSRSAAFAIDYFCIQIAAEIASMAVKSGALDALIFTGGIGENQPMIRQKICEKLQMLGVEIIEKSNQQNFAMIHRPHSIPVAIVKADEESMIRDLAQSCVRGQTTEIPDVTLKGNNNG